MSDNESGRIWNDQNLIWLGVPVGGALLLYGIFGATVWLSTMLAGATAGGLWPGAGTAASALWAQISGDSRIDDWLLTNTAADAVVAPVWFWSIAAVLLVLGILVASLAILSALQVIEPSSKPKSDSDKKEQSEKRDLDRSQRKAARAMTSSRWPIPGPWSYPKNPSPGVLLGQVGRKLIVDDATTPVLVIGPTSSGKTRRVLAPNLAKWPGPAVATSVKPDLAELTVSYRRELGPVWGYDPSGRLWPAMRVMGIEPVVWDPVRLYAASADKNDAILISEFLMSQVSAASSGSQKIWKSHSVEMMIRMLVLAKELQQPLAQLLRWIANPQLVLKLATQPAALERLSPDAHMHLEMLAETVKMDKRIVDSIKTTMLEVSNKLRWTAEHPEASLMPMTMTSDGSSGTLYLIADHASMNSHAAMFAAGLRHLFHSAETYGDQAQRLNHLIIKTQAEATQNAVKDMNVDPITDPLARQQAPRPDTATASAEDGEGDQQQRLLEQLENAQGGSVRPLFCLDELASLAVLEDLPEIISTIRSRAQVISGIQEESQLSRRWDVHAAKALKGNHPTELQLGGSGDVDAMRGRATMSGVKDATAADMRMIEPGKAHVTHGALISFEIDLVDTDRYIDPDRVARVDSAAVKAAWDSISGNLDDPADHQPPAENPPDDAGEQPHPPSEDPNEWGYYDEPPADAGEPDPVLPAAPAQHNDDTAFDAAEQTPATADAREIALDQMGAAAARDSMLARIGQAAGALAPATPTAEPAAVAQMPAASPNGTAPPDDPAPTPADSPADAGQVGAASPEPSASERLRMGAWLLDGLEGGGTDPANLTLVAEMLRIDPDDLARSWRERSTAQETA